MPLKPPHVLDLPGVDPVDGVLSAGTLVLVDHACVEDGANAITEEHRAGWPGSRIGGHQTTTWRLASCSFRMNPSTREASPAVRSPALSFAFMESLCIYGLKC